MTAASRNRGNRIEVVIARYLTDHGPWGEVITTRNAMDGVRRGDDLCLGPKHDPRPLPVSIEVKGARRDQPDPAWLEQARDNAGGRPYVVIWRPNSGPIGRSWVLSPESDGGWSARWLEQWVRQPEFTF
jgi:hypothetical protein